ncbi:hypothetical protein HPB51_006013 [Rhipicephalus microplus]|uniref:Uncharacterized protein n=1 Tax=Rhipicephalus microplus TaxID=6941 RepID=A0A9J6EFP2_RHIMP|nr:hypothetical protein HPB51_006013 [Rhipicephalus microplus]
MCVSPNLSSMPLFPGHRYLSPGNPLHNGDTVDEDGGIAKSHHEAYERATSHEDVFAADQASAALFLKYFRRTDPIVADSVTLPSRVGPYLRHTNESIKASYNSLTRHGRPVNLTPTETEVTDHKAEHLKIVEAPHIGLKKPTLGAFFSTIKAR